MADKKKIDIHILSRVANEVAIRGFADNTADLYGETVISREKPIGHIALQKWQACYSMRPGKPMSFSHGMKGRRIRII